MSSKAPCLVIDFNWLSTLRKTCLLAGLAWGCSWGAAAAPGSQSASSKPVASSNSTDFGAAPKAKPAPPSPVALNKDGQINLIRGLSSEIAVSKVTLPRGKHGISLDTKGKIDQSKAQQELRENGPAINPGTPVKITKIDFKSDRLTFEINGGGKNGKHWYQHIEIGMGTTTQPIATPQGGTQTLAYGSYVTLTFPGRVPNLTAPQVRQLLAPALDFERHSPTVLYSPAVPQKYKEAIKNHQVMVGMNHDAVLSARGAPERKVREDQPDGSEKEDWIYGLPPHVLYVTFDGDMVVRVKQY